MPIILVLVIREDMYILLMLLLRGLMEEVEEDHKLILLRICESEGRDGEGVIFLYFSTFFFSNYNIDILDMTMNMNMKMEKLDHFVVQSRDKFL